MAFQKEHADAFRDLIARFESEAGGRAIVDAIAAALTEEGERLHEAGAYTRGDHYSDAAQELRNNLDRGERTLDAALKGQEPAKDHDDISLRTSTDNDRLRAELAEVTEWLKDAEAEHDRLHDQIGQVTTSWSDEQIITSNLRAHNADLCAAALAVEEAHKVVVSAGITPGSYRRHLEEPLYKLFALRSEISRSLAIEAHDLPAQASTVEQGAERALPLEERPPSETPREATRTLTLAEHVDELRAELRNALDSGERNMIAAELKAAHAVLKEQDNRERETTRPEIESPVANAESPSARKLRDDLPPEQAQEAREIGFIDYKSAGATRNRPLDVAPSRPDAVDAKGHRDDFDTAVARLSAETGLPHTPAAGGEFVAGIYRQSLTLSSGRFAMIDNGLGFALVPWTAELDRHLGRHVVGVAQESGGIDWSFGRKRGLEI